MICGSNGCRNRYACLYINGWQVFCKVQRFRYSQGDRYRALDDRQDKGIFALALYTSTTSLQSASMRSGKNFQKYKIQVDAKDNSS